jgi:EAL domain-containing protein (putative c-di-GMP-specific phosphodiesterase class I)
MIGAEILARWIHPTEGFIPPTRFIPLAERHALTTDLTIEMLRGVAQAWKDGGRSDVRLSVNLSPHDLNWPSMNRIVNAIREEHLFPIDRLTMELTETAMMENPTVAREVLNNLRSMGIKIAVDDFGTGYSSLSNLHTLPIDYLKIDRSFVSEVEMGNDWTRMIGAIQAMADGLGLQTVAEGIETDATTRALTLSALGATGSPAAVATVATGLSDNTVAVRREAARALGGLPGAEATAALVVALTPSNRRIKPPLMVTSGATPPAP